MSTMFLASLKVNKCKVSPSMIWGETHTASVMTCKIKMCQFCNLFDFFFLHDGLSLLYIGLFELSFSSLLFSV